MVFSSSIFLFYFLPVFLVVYFLADRKYKNGIALLASLLFYGFGSPKFLFILLLSILIDFFIVREMAKSQEPKRKKLFLTLSIILNIGLLAYFKYANFFIENFNARIGLFGANPMRWTKVVLPIGISFFTFQKMSYSVDVYRGTSAPLKSIFDYALFIMLFPQLIAGPIVRYNEVAQQIVNRQANETLDNKLFGFYRFVIGLSKKMLIANVLGEYVDKVFALPANELGMGTTWVGILAYTFQIYFDFSGYSDMAIGIGRMIGFKFPENFNFPYISKSVTEFWKRWHITLGSWMMDYLYIPLGGNRKGKGRTYLNLWIVFFLSGLWHGASWNFVAWGAYHGAFICLDKLLKNGKRKTENGKLSTTAGRPFSVFRSPFSVLLTFVIVMVGWVLFRADTLGYAVQYLGTMFGFNGQAPMVFITPQLVFTLIVAAFFSFLGLSAKVSAKIKSANLAKEKSANLANLTNFNSPNSLNSPIINNSPNSLNSPTKKTSPVLSVLAGVVIVVLLLLSASFILKGSFNPFIYFRF